MEMVKLDQVQFWLKDWIHFNLVNIFLASCEILESKYWSMFTNNRIDYNQFRPIPAIFGAAVEWLRQMASRNLNPLTVDFISLHFRSFYYYVFFSVSKSPLACGACATPPENAVISPSIYAPLAVSTSSSFRTEDEGVEVMETNGIIHTRTHTYTHPPTHTHAHAHSGWDTVGGEWVVQREQRSIYSVSEIHKWWIILNWSLLLLFFFLFVVVVVVVTAASGVVTWKRQSATSWIGNVKTGVPNALNLGSVGCFQLFIWLWHSSYCHRRFSIPPVFIFFQFVRLFHSRLLLAYWIPTGPSAEIGVKKKKKKKKMMMMMMMKKKDFISWNELVTRPTGSFNVTLAGCDFPKPLFFDWLIDWFIIIYYYFFFFFIFFFYKSFLLQWIKIDG